MSLLYTYFFHEKTFALFWKHRYDLIVLISLRRAKCYCLENQKNMVFISLILKKTIILEFILDKFLILI